MRSLSVSAMRRSRCRSNIRAHHGADQLRQHDRPHAAPARYRLGAGSALGRSTREWLAPLWGRGVSNRLPIERGLVYPWRVIAGIYPRNELPSERLTSYGSAKLIALSPSSYRAISDAIRGAPLWFPASRPSTSNCVSMMNGRCRFAGRRCVGVNLTWGDGCLVHSKRNGIIRWSPRHQLRRASVTTCGELPESSPRSTSGKCEQLRFAVRSSV